MENTFVAAWNQNREKASALGVRMRPLPEVNPLKEAKHILSGNRTSDGFVRLEQLGHLELSLEALAVDKRFTGLFTDEEANTALTRLLDAGYSFRK